MRSNDLIWANVVNNYLMGNPPPAFDLLYWNSDGTRMARAAHSWYLRNTYVENNLIKPGKVKVLGEPIDLGRIEQDIYAVGAEKDHIVPWYAAWRITQLTGGRVRFVRASSGHIAGVINHPGPKKGAYWVNEEPADLAGGLAGRRVQARGQLVDGLGRVAERALGREGEAPRARQQEAPAAGRRARDLRAGEVAVGGPRTHRQVFEAAAFSRSASHSGRRRMVGSRVELLGRGAFRQAGLGHGVEEQRAFGGRLGQQEVAVSPELTLGREVRVDLEQLDPPALQLGGAAQLGVDQRVPEARVVVVVSIASAAAAASSNRRALK